MARSIATVYGTALVPGVSRNGRLYTREMIAEAVDRAQERIAAGNMLIVPDGTDDPRPLTQRTHHAADDDTLGLIGRISSLTLDESTGAAKFAALLADTKAGHDVLDLVDTSDGQPAFFRGVSIRGAWLGQVRRTVVDGRTVETADGLELEGLDYTANPGVLGAQVERVVRAKPTSTQESAGERVLIYESVQEAVVDPTPAVVTTNTAAPVETAPTEASPAIRYADIGYLPDRQKRLPVDTAEQARTAWLAVAGAHPTAEGYTEPQRKRVRERAVKALREHGYSVDATEQWLISPPLPVTAALAECWDCEPGSSFYVTLDNGMVSVSVSSYRISPADLPVIARAAMDGACNTLAGLDPDNDGDIDVPGAPDEDTDHDLESAPELADGLRAVETAAVDSGQAVQELAATAAEVTETATETPATEQAAEPTEIAEESVVSDETTTQAATEQPAAQAPAAPATVTLSNEQFEQLLAAARGPQADAPAAAPAAPAETTAAAPAAVDETAQVGESEEDRINRVVEARLAALKQQVVADVVQEYGPPTRKGVQKPVTETDAATGIQFGTEGLPADWPQKPLHTYTDEERETFVNSALADRFIPERRPTR